MGRSRFWIPAPYLLDRRSIASGLAAFSLAWQGNHGKFVTCFVIVWLFLGVPICALCLTHCSADLVNLVGFGHRLVPCSVPIPPFSPL